MDISTIIGLVGGAACLMLSIFSSGGQLMTYWDIASVFCTMGGSYFALVIQYSLKGTIQLFKVMGKAFRIPNFNEEALVEKLYVFAEKARREGILSLEDEIRDLDDEFLRGGLRLVVDGTDGEIIRGLMENEINQMNSRHVVKLKMCDAWAKLAPGFGMLGTVLGLIAMLKNLEDKSRIGPNMAVALITTFYGAIMANFLIQPIMGKLSSQDMLETRAKEMIIEGVLSIQAGDNPRILLQKLTSYLEPAKKKVLNDKYAKD